MIDAMIDQAIDKKDVAAFKAITAILSDKGMSSVQMLLKMADFDIADLETELGIDLETLKKIEQDLRTNREIVDVEPIQ